MIFGVGNQEKLGGIEKAIRVSDKEIVMCEELVKLLSRKEVAKLLRCSVGTVANLCKLGELAPLNFGTKGKCVRFLLPDIEQFIAIKRQASGRLPKVQAELQVPTSNKESRYA